ncbi:hypothetical protein Mapa_000467 [Marchantia paleacea]|nr:hypothetical protein Mapa_000467 [Marchantia paleacea]
MCGEVRAALSLSMVTSKFSRQRRKSELKSVWRVRIQKLWRLRSSSSSWRIEGDKDTRDLNPAKSPFPQEKVVKISFKSDNRRRLNIHPFLLNRNLYAGISRHL